MPITRKQFELEIDTKTEEWMEKIRAFLREHSDEAFTSEELHQYFSTTLIELLAGVEKKLVERQEGMDAFYFLPDEKSAFYSALEKLVEIRDVEERKIRDAEYYSYIKEAPF